MLNFYLLHTTEGATPIPFAWIKIFFFLIKLNFNIIIARKLSLQNEEVPVKSFTYFTHSKTFNSYKKNFLGYYFMKYLQLLISIFLRLELVVTIFSGIFGYIQFCWYIHLFKSFSMFLPSVSHDKRILDFPTVKQ